MMALGSSYLLNVGPTPEGTIAPDWRARLEKVGDWYRRMNGCLECHEPDPFDYGVKNNACIVTQKDGKSYFHFPDGLLSTAVAIKNFPREPQRVVLLNTGAELKTCVECLPEFFESKTGVGNVFLHITGIPVDDLASEAIILEVTW
jgi:hypothetical protein